MLSWFKRNSRKASKPDPTMAKLLRSLAMTEARELSCDDVYGVLDQFVEAARRGEDVRALMPLVQHHLDMCPDCREEYEALFRILQPTGT